MKEEKKDKKKKNPLKKAIIEIVISSLILILDFIYLIIAYTNYKHYTAKLYDHLYYIAGIFILCILCLFDGIISIPLAIKKKRKEKQQNNNNDDSIANH